MRVAVLIYGRLNACVHHYSNIMESLGQPVDFFLSSDNSPQQFLDDFIRLYKPILYTNDSIQTCDLSHYSGKRHETNLDTMYRHFKNKNRVFKLFETKNGYDCVVSLRVDCFFNQKFNLNDLKDNTIYIPEGNDFVDGGINDQIAYGKFDVMEKYNSIDPILLLDQHLSIPHPESLTYANLKYHKLFIQRVKLGYVINRH
jgi:hypothetical protein